MLELSKERVEQILHEETAETEELTTILRGIYTRYLRLFEKYFADVDALDDDAVAALRAYHEETKSLVKYYYMDIPLDICVQLEQFDKKYSERLLGAGWHEVLFNNYRDFRDEYARDGESEECLKAEYREHTLAAFYDAMGYVFRDGFGTGSQTAEQVVSRLAGLLFGE